MVENIREQLRRDIYDILKEELDKREVSGSGFS